MSVLIDMDMPRRCEKCRFLIDDILKPTYQCAAANRVFVGGIVSRPKWCPLHEVHIEPDIPIFDKETRIDNCTVQILENTETGRVSIGWWRNE